jgi:hypothetical protein
MCVCWVNVSIRPSIPIYGEGKGKGEVVPVLFFNWAPRHEDVLDEWRYSSTQFLTSALEGSEWSASRPGRFTPQGKSPRYPLDRRLDGPQSRSGRDVIPETT